MKTHQFTTAFHYDDLEPSAELEKYCKEVNLKDVKEHNTSFFEENQEELAKLLVPVVREFWKEAGIITRLHRIQIEAHLDSTIQRRTLT